MIECRPSPNLILNVHCVAPDKSSDASMGGTHRHHEFATHPLQTILILKCARLFPDGAN